MSRQISQHALVLLFFIFCGILRNGFAQEISLSTDYVYSNVVGTNFVYSKGECDVTAAALAKDVQSMRLLVLERLGYGHGVARRLRMIRCEERFKDFATPVMPLPPSEPQIGGTSLSPPGDGLLVFSPDASYCGVYYAQQDDGMLNHYHYMLTGPNLSAIFKRIWTPRTPLRAERHPWVSRWMNEKRLMLNYVTTNPAGNPLLGFDQYEYQTGGEWIRTTKSYEISGHLDVMADHYLESDNTLAVVGYHEVPDSTQWLPYNNPAERILWTVDLEKESILEKDLGVGYAPKSLFQIDGTYGFWTQYIDHSQWSQELLKQRTERYTKISIVMLHEGKTLKRDFQSSSDVNVHAIPEMGLILCCFHTDRGIPLSKQDGDAEPREIDFEEGYERTLRWNDASNWMFLDAKTLDIVDNWIIDTDIYPFTYSEEYHKLIAKSTKYEMFYPPGRQISSYKKGVLEQKIFLLSFHRN